MHVLSLGTAMFLDLLIGDPRWLPHPVRWIGTLVAWLEKGLYPRHRSARKEFLAGAGLCLLTIAVTAGVAQAVLLLCEAISPFIKIAASVVMGFYCLSARSLVTEAGCAAKHLRSGNIAKGRKAVGLIVGRDTHALDDQGVARAAVETIAENITDGIVSPLLYLAIGGPVAALVFKAVSTMDSMTGYHNDRYRHFGTFAARLDDVANFIPARLTAFLLIPVASFLLRFDWKQAMRVAFRDRYKHPSPNSAHGEAAIAGALGIQLGGGATYGGVFSPKPFLGDSRRPIEVRDITRANKVAIAVTLLLTVLASVGLWAGSQAVRGFS